MFFKDQISPDCLGEYIVMHDMTNVLNCPTITTRGASLCYQF